MTDERRPYQIIADMVTARARRSAMGRYSRSWPFDPCRTKMTQLGEQDATWQEAYRFVALADAAPTRRLKPAIRLLLDRACYGDPGEMFRGLRHASEAIVNPRWSELADICLEAATSPRLGTRLWAIDQLTVFEDERARLVFEESMCSDPEEISGGPRSAWNASTKGGVGRPNQVACCQRVILEAHSGSNGVRFLSTP